MVEKTEIDFFEKRGRVRQGQGKMADMADLRADDKVGLEETKEEIIAIAVEPFPRVDVIEENEKVSIII